MTTRLQEHPCFSTNGSCGFGRIHLPVAPRCNIQCAFCDRQYDCANESRPGVTSAIISPQEAAARTAEAIRRESRIRVAGIAGPGDSLANPETLETLALLRQQLPDLILCLSTNGLLVEQYIDQLAALRLDTITITINAFSEETAARLYTAVRWNDQPLPTSEGLPLLLAQQRKALRLCAQAGIAVKVNTVLVPGINDGEIIHIARQAAQAGAVRMNVMPLIPCGAMAASKAPTAQQLQDARAAAGQYIRQFTHCRQCRADACGLL